MRTGQGGDRQQHRAGVADGAVGDDALGIAADQGGEGADRQAGDRGQGQAPADRGGRGDAGRHAGQQGADQHGGGGELGHHAEQGDGDGRGALVDVGGVEVEGDDGQLVGDAHPGQDQRTEHRQRHAVGHHLADAGEVEVAGDAVDVAHAEEHQAAGGAAEQHVLHAGLG